MNCSFWKSSSDKGNLGVTCLRIIPAFLLLLLLGASDTSAQTYSTWTHNKVILFNTSASGANVAGNVSNFPVLVRLNSGNFDFSQALTGGADIRFEDPDGTALAYQIERWDYAVQVAEIWVRVPQVDGNSVTDYIRMFWGKAGSTSESNGNTVFQTSNGFAGAWHLNEDGNTAAGGYPDATANGNSGTGTALTTTSDVSAISAMGQNFATASNQMINFGSGSTLNGSTTLTIEAWINTTTQIGNAVILSKAYTSNTTPFDEYKLDFNSAGNIVRFGVTTGGVSSWTPGTTTLSNGIWYHVAGTYDGSNIRFYLNGVEEGSASKTGAMDNYTQALTIGKYYWDNTKNFNGVIDEPRVATTIRSPDWIKLTYSNQNPTQNLIVIAPRVWDGGGADALWSNPLNWNGDVLPTPDEAVLFDGTSIDDAALDMNVSVKSISFTAGYTGNFSFSSYVLTVNEAQADFRSGGTITPGTGTLRFTGVSSQNFHPHSSANLPSVVQDGPGTTTIQTYPATVENLSVLAGTFHLGTGMGHFAASVSTGGGTLDFGSSTLSVFSGDVNLSGLSTLTPGGGSLYFTAPSGTQTFTPKSGALHPALAISGAGTVLVSTNSIIANSLTVTSGEFNTTTNAMDITVGALTINGGTLTADGGNIDVDGDFSMTTGTLACPNTAQTFSVTGNLTQSGGTINPGTGKLTFAAVSVGRTINSLATWNSLEFNGIGGGWTVTSNGLNTGALAVANGTLNLGSGLTHTVSGNFTSASGILEFNTSTLKIAGATADFSSLGSVTANTGILEFNGATAQTFTPKSSSSHPAIIKSGSGTVTLATYAISTAGLSISAGGFDLSTIGATVNGDLAISGGIFTATNSSLSVAGNFTLSGGSILMPTGIMYVGGNVSRTAGTATHNNGWLTLNGVTTGKTFDFSPTLYCLNVAASGGEWTAVNNGFNVSNMFQVQNGTFILGSVTHTTATLNSTGSGTLDFGSSTVNVTGNTVYLDGLTTFTPGSGTLVFQDASGVQTLTAKAGADAPHISHTGAGTLQLATNNLSCLSFTQTDGILDLNALNITTVSSGNFTLTNGTTTSLTGLAARTIAVAGNATLAGTDKTNRLNLNPAGAWYLNVTGTASVQLASVNNANSAGYSTVACTNCANEGTSTNWTFAVTWDGGGGNANWSNAGNWASGYVPTSQDDVTFDATAFNATLDAAASVRSLTFTTGYTGTFNFSSNTLTIGFSNADLRSGGNVLGGTGTLEFTSAAAQTFIPKNAAMHPTIKQNGNGGTSVITNHLSANGLTIAAGTFFVGDRSVNVTSVNFTGGGLDFGTGWLSVSGATVDFSALGTLTAGTGELEFTGSSPQTFIPKNGATFPTVKQNGSGGTTVSTYGLTMNSLTLSGGTLNLGTGLTHSAAGLNVFGGGLDFGSSTLQFSGSSASFTSLTSMTASSGALAFTGSSAQAFTPKASLTFPAITQNGTGGTTVYTNNLTAGALSIVSGTFNLGASLSHVVSSISTTAGGLNFNSSTLSVNSGIVSLNGLTTLTPSTGTLAFTASSGVQTFTPKSASSHPAIIHSGAGELELATYDLSCLGFNQSAGILDFGGRNITTTAGGNFTLTNGTASTLVGLAGRTLTVAGNASLSGGASTSRLNLNPGAVWTLAVTGTLTGSLASLDFSNASVSAGSCSNCANQGSNSNWAFAVMWDGGGSGNNWSTAENWGSDAVPTAGDDVVFDGTSTKDATLDVSTSIKSLTFTSEYSGAFSFGSATLSITGNVDLRSGAAAAFGFFGGSGTIAFTGTSPQNFYSKGSDVLPNLTQNGSGGTTLQGTASLYAGHLTISSGTFHLGSTVSSSITVIDISGSGGLDFGLFHLNARGNVDFSGLTITATSANRLRFRSGGQSYIPNPSVTELGLEMDNSNGDVTILNTGFTTPLLQISAGTVNLGAGLTHTVTTTLVVNATGNLNFGSSILAVGAATVNFSNMTTLTPGTGTLVFNGSSAQAFTPKASATHPNITQYGAGGTTITTNGLTAGTLTLNQGTFNLGTALSHTFASVFDGGGGPYGSLHFNSSQLHVTGNVSLGNSPTVTAGSGSLYFEATSGTQSFTPKSATTFPAIYHTGAGILQLNTYDLTCASFSQTDGTLDFNALNISTTLGDFTLTSGTSTSLAGLAGRTLTVAGNASFSGAASTSRLNLNPGAAWTLAVTGSLTASLASLDNSNASGSAGSCSNCVNAGNNTNWTFAVTWDGGGSDINWTTALNWGSDAVPTSLDDVTFDATATNSANLDAAATIKSITFTSGYTGTFSFSTNTLSVTGNADFRSGGPITAGTGTLAFTGTGAQTFIPKSGATFPAINQNGNGGVTTITTNPLSADALTLTLGTFHLGASLTHTVGTISGSGTLDFGSSNLNATGNVGLATATVAAISGSTLGFTGSSAQTYAPNAAEPDLNLTQNGSGGTTVNTTSFTTPVLTIASGTLNLGSSLVHTVSTTLSISGGGLNFSSSTLQVAATTVDLSSLATLTPGSGFLNFTGASAQNFTPKALATHPHITQSGTGGFAILTNGLNAGDVALSQGSINLGSSLAHSIKSIDGYAASGTFDFGSSQLHITTGNFTIGNMGTVTIGTGSLHFDAASGNQAIYPKAGITHPNIYHAGAGRLWLYTNDLICKSFSQSAGILDLNFHELTTTNGGDFSITNGTPTTIQNLDGRTITVAGNATLSGTAGASRLNLNPVASWTLAVTGSLTGDLVSLDYSNASVSAGSCTNCANGGNNSNWSFATQWDGGGGDANWTTAANWGSDAVPTSGEDVSFNATSLSATLDAAASVKSITFTSGYTGTFSFSSNTLTVNSGNADFRSGGAITAGTGTLAFTATGAQTFIPKTGILFPALTLNGTGGVTLSTNNLSGGDLTLTSGNLTLGTGMTHSVGNIVPGVGAGIIFGNSTLQAGGTSVSLANLGTLNYGTGTLEFTGTSAQTFTGKSGVFHPSIRQNGAGGTTIATNNWTTGTLTITTGTLNLGTGRSIVTNTFSATGGGIDFGSSTLEIDGATVDFSSLASVTAGTGTLYFGGGSAQTFTPKSGATFPNIRQYGSGGTTIASNNLTAGSLTLNQGTFNLGSALSHTFSSVFDGGGGPYGNLNFGSSQLHVTGDVTLGNVPTLTPGTGTLAFDAASGTQVFVPVSGGVSHPAITHSGAGTLQLSTNNLSCLGFSQSAGSLDFNGVEITSTGDFTLTGGTTTSLSNLAGRTITVGGNASLAGSASSNRLNLNPGAAWSLAVTGTLTGSLASLDYSNASVSAGACSNCANGANNSNWTFAIDWDGGGADANWTTAANWGSDAVPTTADDVTFSSTSTGATLDAAASVKSITFTTGYTGAFSFSSNTLSVTGNADFRSGGAINANTGALAFTGTGTQTFIPKAGATFPAITQNGNSGTTTITTNALTAGNLTLTLGTLNLGASLTHTVGAVSGSGSLDFGTSNLNATGDVDLSGLAVTASSSNTLAFTGASAQSHTHKTGLTSLNLSQNGAGGTTLASQITMPNLTIAAGNLTLGSGFIHIVNSVITVTGGGLIFTPISELRTPAATVDFSALTSISGTGAIVFTGASAQTFTPKASSTHPTIHQAGSGGTTIAGNALSTTRIYITAGTLDLGTGFTHSTVELATTGGGISFNNSTVLVTTAGADFSGLASLSPGTGTVAFTATIETQVLTPKSGANHPGITHTGAGTLQLATNALSCASFSQSAGTLNLNSLDITTIASGNFTLSNGTSTTLVGLAGRTITVAGNASFSGASSADRLNLNPGALWYLDVDGTLSSSFATLDYSNASASTATGSCSNCANVAGNTNWTFATSWDGGAGDNFWSTAGNWGSDFVPTASDDVTFNATAINATLDAAATVKSITFTSGYTGTFSFSTNTLTINSGNADFRSGGAITAGTGTLAFTGASPQTFIPKTGATFPAIIQNGAGGTTLSTNELNAGDVSISSGTFNLGTSLSHYIGGISGSGGLDFGISQLYCSGNVDLSGLSVAATTSNTLNFIGASAQTFAPNATVTALNLHQNGAGGTTVVTNDFTAPALTISSGTLNLGAGRLHTVSSTLSVSGGGLDFSSSNLQVAATAINFTNLAVFNAGTGILEFTGGSSQTFTPKTGYNQPYLKQNGSGGTTLAGSLASCNGIYVTSGTLSLGSSLGHSAQFVTATGGNLDFGSSALTITLGNVDLANLQSLVAGTGSMNLNSGGTLVLIPKSGSTHPAITHFGTGTVQLSTYDLICQSYSQSDGILDLNGRNITTVTGGDFTISNGTSSTLVGLAGRTLTVAGAATFTGASSANRLNLDPVSTWTLAVSGTLSASYASLGGSSASIAAGACTNCANMSANTNWNFAVGWDGGAGDNKWSTAGNWGSDLVPTTADDVTFDATASDATLDAAASVKSITFTSSYTGTFSFSTNTLTINSGNADFRSGGAITAGTGALAFTGASPQTFIPKASTVFPSIVQNGSGGTTLSTNALTAGSFVVTSGTLNLGASFTHTVGTITGSGGLHFGTSSVNATGNIDLSSLTVTASASNTLAFTGTSAQTYSPNPSVTALNLSQNGTGGTTVVTNNISTPSLSIASGTFNLGAGRTVYVSSTLNFTGGGLDFGSSYLQTEAATVDLTGLSTLTANSGYLVFLGSSAQVLIPKAATTHPGITQNGSGGTTLSTNDLAAGDLTVIAGTFNLGASGNHSTTSISGSGGELHFNSSTLQVTSGNANLGSLTTVTRGSGTLAFTASNGTQVFTPKAGQDHPAISHTGAATLQLLTNNLSCASFANSAGALDLNGQDIATISSGNFTVANGTVSTFTALAGRTLTVAGDASLSGSTSASRLNLNPGAAWTLAVTGTLTGNLVSLDYSSASTSAGICSNCANGGNNTNWNFDVTWDGEGGDANWSTAGNWGSDAVPTNLDNVTFNATSMDATLDAAATVKSITFTSAYTGAFSFSANTLNVTGDADFRSGGIINANTGTLAFTGTGAQTFIPKSGAVFPAITQIGNAGITTITTNALAAGNLTLASGTLNLGSSMTHTVGAISGSAGLDFGTSDLNATGDVDLSGATVTAASSNSLSFTGASAQTFTPKSSVTALNLIQNGTGGTTVSANNFIAGGLTLASGTLNLGAGLTHSIATLSAIGGGLHFGSSTLKVSAATVDLDPLATLTAGTGTLELNGASQTLAPKASTTHPSLTLNNSTGATLVTRGWTGGALTIASGSANLGAGLSHSFTDIVTPNSGSLLFGSSAVDVSGNANFNGLTLVDGGTGSLTFSASSGTQIFTPETGSAFPALYHTGAGILQLATNDLDCSSFNQSAGTLDLNGRNITTAAFGGFTVTNGTAASFTGLAGRTLTVGGNASFTGQAGNLVNLNPASSWTLAVSGTLAATLAQIAFCNALGSTGDAMSSVDGGGNTNWSFSVTWDGGGTDENWNTSANWSSDAVPIASTKVLFDASTTKDCNLDGAATVKSIVFGTGYSGTFSFATNTLNVTGLADFRSGGPITAGVGALTFSGAAAQTFIPKPAAVFPTITQNGAGGTTVATNNLAAAGLSLVNGTLNLGSGLTHAVTTVGGTGGGLDFGGSTLSAGGNVDFSGLSALTAGIGRLELSGSGTQSFSPKAGAIHPRIAQTGTGATTLSGAGLTTISLRLIAGTLNLGPGLSHSVTDTLLATGGTLDFGSSTLKTAAASPDFSGLTALVAGTGTLEFNGASPQAFTPKSLATHPSVSQNGTGGTILLGSLTAGNVSIASGTFNLGASFSHTFSGLSTTGGGLDFGGSLLSTIGNADFSGLSILTAGSGTLAFTASSGTHVFIPKSGAVHPLIAHHAADTLRLSTNALSALGFAQTAGVLDLNGQDLTLAAGGNLDITGGALPFLGLGGRTLTVSGDARLAGTASVKLDLNPASAWTLAVGGLLSAANVRLANSVASSSGGVADSSLNLGGNSNWIFLDTIKPDNVSDFLASALGGTSAALSWTPSVSEDADSVAIRYRTDGVYPASSTDGTLWRKVPATWSTDTATGLAEKVVYHFAAFVKDSSGNFSPAAAGARDSTRTPDVTPPANAADLVASSITQTSVALAWTPSAAPDADTVMIRYLAGTTHPADTDGGLLWKKLPNGFTKDTVTGLAANTIYAFSLFVRDSAGNYSPASAGAQDTSLYQLPVSGTLAINDLSGLTGDSDPSVAFTWSGADSLRFGPSSDTAVAPWKAVRSLDSVALGAADGLKILAVQFKNIFGTRSPWYFDSTTLDRAAPVVTLDLKAAHSRWDWPVSVSGKSKDSLVGTDRVFVVRKRLADGFHFNGASWVSTPDTAKLVLGASDSIFSAPLPAAAMTTGDYQFTAYARDLAGNMSTPVVSAVHFEENRMPALASGNVPDTVLQNQTGEWSLDFGDMDAADSLIAVSFDAPAWLTPAPGPDTAYAPWALHKVFTLSGKPLQAHVGSNTVRVLMQDRAGLIFTYTKPILVVDVNDAPVFADSQAVYSVDEDSESRWTPGFNDEDVLDTHTMTLLAGPAFAKVDGLAVVFNPASRDAGDHSVRVAVSDGSLRDTLETLVTVVNVNDPPYAFPSKGWQSPAFWKEDQRDTFTVVVVDMDRNDPVNLVTPMPAFVKVSSTVDSTGFNRSFQFVLTPGQGDTGSISLALTFQDAAGATSKLALTGRVVPFNDTPFAAIEDISTHAGAARIRLAVTDEDGSLEKARFHYRLIGASGDTLRRGITPSSQLALHPLADGAYTIAIMAEDQDGAKQPAYTVKPFSISGATRIVLDSARWHMLGAPHASLPASVFGAGATLASWDETGDDGQPLARYSSGKTVESLKRGKGYWVRLPMPITVNAIRSDLLEGPFTLKLTHSKQGWNQVANPYPYFVDVSASRLTWWEWDAEKRDLVNARGLLKPWAAYWVLAPRDTTLVLSDIPYFPAVAGVLAKAASASGADFRNREDWSVQLSLKAGGYHDQANLLGVRSMPGVPDMRSDVVGGGAPGVAPEKVSPGLSLPDAPKFGDYVALHFEKTGLGADQGFATDFHSRLDPEEEWWDISVENTGTGENQAQLTPAGLEALAKNGLNLFLVRQGEATRIEPGGSVTLSLDAEKTYYSLVVTPHADFASRLKGNFSISQNFPNPVTTFTAFRFFLPQSWDKDGKRMAKDFKLRINLYDYSGRRVAQVASGSFRPGSHTLLWRPVSNGGGALSKGAYIYRLETAGFVKSLKLVVE